MAGFHRLHPATHRASICENVLGRLIALEPKQADLLTRICDGPLIHAEDIHGLLAIAAPVISR